MVAEIAELVRFDFMFLGFGIVYVTLASAETPRTLHDALLAKKISGLDGVGFVGSPKDHSVAKV